MKADQDKAERKRRGGCAAAHGSWPMNAVTRRGAR